MIIIKSRKKHPAHTEKTIRILSKKLREKDVKTTIVALEEMEVFLQKDNVTIKTSTWYPHDNDRVFFRIAEKYKNASFLLSSYLKTKRISFIDNYHSATRERNKLIQMFLLTTNGINIPKTYYSPCYDSKKIKNAVKFLNLPIVIKLTNEDRGEGVFLARSVKETLKITKEHANKEMIFQEFIENNFDYRILVLGHKSKLAEKRIRTSKTDFRNNVSTGAREEFLDINKTPSKIRRISEDSSRIMDIQVCGVDVIESNDGTPYVIEVNVSPSFTLDDKVSQELNILSAYLKQWNEKR